MAIDLKDINDITKAFIDSYKDDLAKALPSAVIANEGLKQTQKVYFLNKDKIYTWEDVCAPSTAPKDPDKWDDIYNDK